MDPLGCWRQFPTPGTVTANSTLSKDPPKARAPRRVTRYRGKCLPSHSAALAERLSSIIHVQKYDVSVLEAIYHVVEHFAQHTGQIIFATKMLTGEELGFYNHLKQPAHREKTP